MRYNTLLDVDKLLDEQLVAGIRGDFERGQQIANNLQIMAPDDPRAAFNRAFYELRKGDLLKGHKLLDVGRQINVFGNPHIGSTRPIWNGEKGTVLLNLEGGLGDQIHGFRFARVIKERGCRVIVVCSPELAPIFAEQFITVQPEAALGVYHDYWVPSMSVVVPLKWEYNDIDGQPYINRTTDCVEGRVGLRWSGSPEFEHQQHRLFPPELLFDAVENLDCVSLQRDEGSELKPDWIPQVDVLDWEATRKSISKCQLVISSCTSVVHLSAAMGIPTWIIVPILPYYLWAYPGGKAYYYRSVVLFRQKQYGCWIRPFQKIKANLKTVMCSSVEPYIRDRKLEREGVVCADTHSP